MGLKDVINRNLDRLTTEIIPTLRQVADEQLTQVRAKLDHFNRALADKALPKERKKRVGHISLETKAKEASQGKAAASKAKTVPKDSRKSSQRPKAD